MSKQIRFIGQLKLLALCACLQVNVCSSVIASVAMTIDFDTRTRRNGSIEALNHGDVIANQYRSEFGVRIRTDNFNIPGSPDEAVVFDTTLENTQDPDLEAPFDGGGNLPASTVLGNVLIIQENPGGPPDDEGRRPAGEIVFTFDTPITSFGFDVIDVESAEIRGSDPDEGYFVDIYTNNDRGRPARLVESFNFEDFEAGGRLAGSNPAVFNGDNSANRIEPITVEDLRTFTGPNNSITDFTRVVIRFGGSGAIDNVSFTNASAIPEAGSLLTWLLLCVGACRSREFAK